MMMKKVLIATVKPFAPETLPLIKTLCNKAAYEMELIEKYESQNDLIEAVKGANALIIRSDKVTREVIEAAESLEIVVRAGAGYDNVDLEAATANNVVVMNTPGQNSNAVAELALGMMVYFARNLFNGKPGTELKGKKLGMHAYGHVGKLVANIAKGFGMEIFAFDPYIENDNIRKDNVIPVDSVEELYRKCQYISLHIPANEKTKGSVNYNLMKQMPEGATIINTARKEVVDEVSLLKIMEERSDFGYLADVAPDCKDEFDQKYEGRYYFTPKKMGAQTKEANVNAGVAAANQIIDFFTKDDITYKVN
jgi:D-3-phosphoglycerate dehydrogenase